MQRGRKAEGEREGVVAEPGRTKWGTKGSMEKRSQHRLDVESGGEDRESVQAKSKPRYKVGKWSKAELAEAADLGAMVMELVKVKEKKINRSPCEILLHAGLGIKLGRKSNSWLKYEAWYAQTYPKPENSMSFIRFPLTYV